jgi:hypothetical protein
MASILHLSQNMEDELLGCDMDARAAHAPPTLAFVVAHRDQHGGRGRSGHGGRGDRGMSNQCSALGSCNYIVPFARLRTPFCCSGHLLSAS